MKIHGNKPPEGREVNLSAQKVVKAEGQENAVVSENNKIFRDKVDISDKGKEVAELMAAIGRIPDVRNDKVKAIREAIESGKYNADSMKIAQKLLEEL